MSFASNDLEWAVGFLSTVTGYLTSDSYHCMTEPICEAGEVVSAANELDLLELKCDEKPLRAANGLPRVGSGQVP